MTGRTRDLPVFPLAPEPIRPGVAPDVAPVRREIVATGAEDGPRIALITLGCDKNTVDSERMMDERIEGDAEYIAVARTPAQALDIDGVTNLRGTVPVVPGSMVEVRIVDALDYDLVGEVRDASNSSTDS